MTPAQFLAKLKRGEVPPMVLLLGSENYDRARCRAALIAAHLPEEERENGLTQYDLSASSLAEVTDDARGMSLFASRRVLLVTGAEAAMPRTGRGTDDEEEGESSANGDSNALQSYADDPTPGTVIVWEATRFGFEGDEKKKTERVRKFYSAVPEVVELRPYTPEEALALLRTMAKGVNVSFEPGVAEMLMEALGGEAGRITNEMEKLSLFAGPGRSITANDLMALVPDAREANIFALVNALGRRDRKRALGVLDTLVREGEYLPLALSFLSGQFRMALIAKEAGLRNSAQIQSHFKNSGVPIWGSRAEQVTETAEKFSRQQLERGLRMMFKADRDLRSARPDDRVIMERFVVELTAH